MPVPCLVTVCYDGHVTKTVVDKYPTPTSAAGVHRRKVLCYLRNKQLRRLPGTNV